MQCSNKIQQKKLEHIPFKDTLIVEKIFIQYRNA